MSKSETNQRHLKFDRLPQKMDEPEGRKMLEKLGFVFGKDLDDLFVSVTPPEGWTLRSSGNSMWEYAYDEQNRQRIGIFHKAAFYDQAAHLTIHRRFGISPYQACDVDGHRIDSDEIIPKHMLCEIVDHDDSCVIVIGKRDGDDYKRGDVLEARAKVWLNENKPEWLNPLAYW